MKEMDIERIKVSINKIAESEIKILLTDTVLKSGLVRSEEDIIELQKYKTVIVAGMHYDIHAEIKLSDDFCISSYYYFSNEYYKSLKKLSEELNKEGIYNHLISHIDLKNAANISGIGYYGKNNLIHNDRFGSSMFLAAIGFEGKADIYDSLNQVLSDCKECRKCMENCNTGAIQEEKIFQRNRCIRNYMLSKETAPLEIRLKINNRLLGCDECQLVCPKNIKISGKKQIIHPENKISIEDIIGTGNHKSGESIKIIGNTLGKNYQRKNRIIAGLIIVASNVYGKEHSEYYRSFSENENETIREYAAWALEREEKDSEC